MTAPWDLSGGQLKGAGPLHSAQPSSCGKPPGLGSAASWECSLALRCAASYPALGPAGRGPPCQGPWHLRGTVPSPPFQGPRHLWLGTEAPPLRQLCGCSDHGEGVAHAGSAVPILVPPRMAATWPVPPLCQGPRHLQEGAHVPAWGVCAPSRPFGPYQGPRHPAGGRGQRP